MMSYQLLVRFIGVEHQRFMMGGEIWTVIGKDVLAKKLAATLMLVSSTGVITGVRLSCSQQTECKL